ncbi:MAG: hypothetical protein CME71_00500 [Halobacteriovorax sp.]|nr:hypothetical protein [Halobacteriovorax sp.]|tara:strand:- start:779 stop:1045 length:267 start_codon:yes stop_codon:yes gene_type:complete
MNIEYHNFIGTFGVLLTLLAYFLLQAGKWQSSQTRFSLANAVGSAMILFSLYFDFNFSGFLIESVWVVISLYGLYKSLQLRKLNAPSP